MYSLAYKKNTTTCDMVELKDLWNAALHTEWCWVLGEYLQQLWSINSFIARVLRSKCLVKTTTGLWNNALIRRIVSSCVVAAVTSAAFDVLMITNGCLTSWWLDHNHHNVDVVFDVCCIFRTLRGSIKNWMLSVLFSYTRRTGL